MPLEAANIYLRYNVFAVTFFLFSKNHPCPLFPFDHGHFVTLFSSAGTGGFSLQRVEQLVVQVITHEMDASQHL